MRKIIAAASVFLGGVALTFLSGERTPALAQPADPPATLEGLWKSKKFAYQDAGQCMGCHTAPNIQRATPAPDGPGAWEVSLLTEYAIWKVHDKHAQGYAVLDGPRGKKIAELMGQPGKPLNVLDAKAGCISCHAMNNLNDYNKEIGIGGIDPRDGVSCGGCHGPSSDWTNVHADRKQWRDKLTTKEKEDRGFRDLRDPVKRAELCMSCHIGNAGEGKVVTHSMMAAGHPPLPPIEMATFSKNEPQHWRDPKETPAFKNWKNLDFQQTRFAIIGNVVAVRESMKLARDRANFKAAKPDVLFPELLVERDWAKPLPDAATLQKEAPGRWSEVALAHSDCFACHHDLRFPGYRQERGFGYHVPSLGLKQVAPGRPVIRSWPLAALKVAADQTGKDVLKGLDGKLDALAATTSKRPFGNPGEIARDADAIVKWCDEVLADLQKSSFDRTAATKILHGLCDMFDSTGKSPFVADYETARQVASLIVVVASDLGLKSAEQTKLLDGMTKKLNLKPYFNQKERVDILLDVIRKAAKIQPGEKVMFDADAAKFSKYLLNIGDTAMLQKETLNDIWNNAFLVALQNRVQNAGFTEQIRQKDHIDRLQAFSDEEQRRALDAIADYDVKELQETMKTLKAILPK